jgi:hypothetical protein
MLCNALLSIVFEANSHISRLEALAFCESGLTSIHLPASVSVIGEFCFSGCGSLTSITIESGSRLFRLANRAFCGSGLTAIHVPASISVIGAFCFSGCDSLTSITFDPASKFRGSEAGLSLGEPDSREATALFDD